MSAQNFLMAPQFTQRESQSLYMCSEPSSLSEPSPSRLPDYIPLQPHWSACYYSKMPGKLSPQGRCAGCFFSLKRSSTPYVNATFSTKRILFTLLYIIPPTPPLLLILLIVFLILFAPISYGKLSPITWKTSSKLCNLLIHHVCVYYQCSYL